MMCVYALTLVVCVLFFFFKQKTAYEMRISDWSSDVCSSDLIRHRLYRRDRARTGHRPCRRPRTGLHAAGHHAGMRRQSHLGARRAGGARVRDRHERGRACARDPDAAAEPGRSEEHTSELQSLMRSSYAVLCLKTNKTNK